MTAFNYMIRKIQLFRSRINILQKDANCINTTCLIKGSHRDALFLAGQSSVLWLAKQNLLLAGDVESNPGPTLVCAARPHAGAGASAHVLNHTTTPTQHSTLTQANNSKLAPKTHHTTQ